MIPITMADVVAWKKQEEKQRAADKRWVKDTYHYIQGLFERIAPGKTVEDNVGVVFNGDVRVWTNEEGLIIHSPRHGQKVYDRSPDGDRALQERLLSELASTIP
jgi:hypothetical protein